MNAAINRALAARAGLLDEAHRAAVRLFNGFYEAAEDYPPLHDLVIDLYAQTLALFCRSDDIKTMETAQACLLERLPWVTCVVQKIRHAASPALRRGQITFGAHPAERICEHGVWYAVDLTMNQDASFYLDTRSLRRWLLDNACGWSVLNAFAYTGSLGVAALAGGAQLVVQVDRSHKFLDLARRSCALNHLDLGKMKLRAADFFSETAFLRHSGHLFDCAIIDPPFFSTTEKGSVDLLNQGARLVNKVRPLLKDGGRLVVIHNALFLSGADYLRSLENLCADGYLSIEQIIPVTEDCTGRADLQVSGPPVDPAPFNHPTKIALLRVRRKS